MYAIVQMARLRSLANRHKFFWELSHSGEDGDVPILKTAGTTHGEGNADPHQLLGLPVKSPPEECDSCGAQAESTRIHAKEGDEKSNGYFFRCSPCGCRCCERCLWRVFCMPPQLVSEDYGQLRCARCRVALDAPGLPDGLRALQELQSIRDVCRHCGEQGHWERNCPLLLDGNCHSQATGTEVPEKEYGADHVRDSTVVYAATLRDETTLKEGCSGPPDGVAALKPGAPTHDAKSIDDERDEHDERHALDADAEDEGTEAEGKRGKYVWRGKTTIFVERYWTCKWCFYDNFGARERCIVCNLDPDCQLAGRRFSGLPPLAAACSYVARLTHAQRLEALHHAAARSETALLSALHAAGVSFESPDEYGFSALHTASWHGAVISIRRMIALGANPRPPRAHGGSTPGTIAAANGHSAVLKVLEEIGADLESAGSEEGIAPIDYIFRRKAVPILELRCADQHSTSSDSVASSVACALKAMSLTDPAESQHDTDMHATSERFFVSAPFRMRRLSMQRDAHIDAAVQWLISPSDTHVGAGSVTVDGALSDDFLARLVSLFHTLPLAARYKCTQGLNDRAYYCDAEGWIREALLSAVCSIGDGSPVQGIAMAHMRFLLYAEAGGGLPPHVDLSRTDDEGMQRSCSSIRSEPTRSATLFASLPGPNSLVGSLLLCS